MAYLSYNKLRDSEFHNIVFKKDKVQDLNINQLKLEVHDSYKNDQKLTTNFKPSNDEVVINKAYLEAILLKIDGHLLFLEKDYNEFKLQYDKQTRNFNSGSCGRTNQILYDKGLFDSFPKADKVIKDFLFVTKRRSDLGKVNDDIQ